MGKRERKDEEEIRKREGRDEVMEFLPFLTFSFPRLFLILTIFIRRCNGSYQF